MAKVTEYNPPDAEWLYTDADGVDHFQGELWRMIAGGAYPEDPAGDLDIIGASQRGARVSQQGDGSVAQKEIRDPFRECTELWNSLPAECPTTPSDPPATSKLGVWEAKQEHGVVCSYYDLFLRCCMQFALSHDGSMPQGDCFPCDDLCICAGITIGFTTQQMAIDEEQTLYALGAIDGCLYTWGLTGGGSLSAETGSSVVYTAPSSNAGCANNATITLSTNEGICDTLKIAVNAVAVSSRAYEVKWITDSSGICAYSPYNTDPCDYWCGPKTFFMVAQYSCEGVESRRCAGDPFFCWYTNPEEDVPAVRGSCTDGFTTMGLNNSLGTTDLRSDAAKELGCCPAQLL